MTWVYLSPHFDDVALSCGGLVWEQAHRGENVSIWTLCAGEPPVKDLSPFALELHNRWQMGADAPLSRNHEDILSCQLLGAGYRHFSFPDCIYRRHPQTGEYMYTSEQALNGPLHPGDFQLVQSLFNELRNDLPTNSTVVCPLALGNHVDHQLTRRAAEALGNQLWYYADFPYVLRNRVDIESLEQSGWRKRNFAISQPGLVAWQDSIAAHGSQISTFWPDEGEMRQAVSDYCNNNHGVCLWGKPA